MKRFLILTIAPALLMGCATLNRPECQNADWYMIGMEDGANGLPASHVGKHRNACAKYDVTPDLEEYRSGHDEGLTQFCTETKGFDLGRQGRQYHGVCPAELEETFLESYNQGAELFSRQNALKRTSDNIHSNKRRASQVRDELKEKKQQLVSQTTSEIERRDLLDEIEELQDKLYEIEDRIERDIRSKEKQTIELQAFEAQLGY